MKKFDFKEKPFEIHGVPFFEKTGLLIRLPDDVTKQVPSLESLGKRTPGARLMFRTDSKCVKVRMELAHCRADASMSLYAAQSGNFFIGRAEKCEYRGLIKPTDGYGSQFAEGILEKSAEMEDVMILLPRNTHISGITVEIDEGATLSKPTPYRYSKPILFYGSSIVEGAATSRVSNAYPALISRWLDADYYNYGFSASCKAELPLADYFSLIDMSVFVYDYDHNAPDTDFLKHTHERFFLKMREKNPDLPIIIITRPDVDFCSECSERKDVIFKTYDNAVKRGDKNVAFIDGKLLFGTDDRQVCIADSVHPNDLGAFRMASVIKPVIQYFLKEKA